MVEFPEGEVGGKRVVVEERATGRGEMRWGCGVGEATTFVDEEDVEEVVEDEARGGRVEVGMGPRSSSSTLISEVERTEGVVGEEEEVVVVGVVGGRDEGKRSMVGTDALEEEEGKAEENPPDEFEEGSGELSKRGLMRIAFVSISPPVPPSEPVASGSSRARKGMGLKMGVLA